MKNKVNKKIIKKLFKTPTYIVLMLIYFYKCCISPMFPGCCRFSPTCSEYAYQSFKRFGFLKGLYLTIRRLLKCHPFGKKGYDPVPKSFNIKNK